jgi:PleD family two-component response regulator
MTASIGVTASGPDQSYPSAEAMVAAADEALYRAKNFGSNRCASSARPPVQSESPDSDRTSTAK